MKKELRVVANGCVQVTIADERWYIRSTPDPITGLPDGHEFVPSVTWISSFYPKGRGFYLWLANHGWDEAEEIRIAAGEKGSKIHQAAGDLIDGKVVPMDAPYRNPTTGELEPLSLEEYDALLSFREFWTGARPRPFLREFVVWGDGYAGTGDLLCEITADEIDGVKHARGLWLIDLKSGREVWPSFEIQVSAYKRALPSVADLLPEEVRLACPLARLGILQVGYRKNRRHWKLTEVADQYPLFEAARAIWVKETEGQAPFRAEYPLELALPALGETPPPLATPIRRARKKAMQGELGTGAA